MDPSDHDSDEADHKYGERPKKPEPNCRVSSCRVRIAGVNTDVKVPVGGPDQRAKAQDHDGFEDHELGHSATALSHRQSLDPLPVLGAR